MKYIGIVKLIIVLTSLNLFSQGVSFDNTGGKINNLGVLRIKAGQVKNLNDTIDGRVEFTATCPAFTQEVPNVVYNQLVISGAGLKIIDTVRKISNTAVPLIARDSLLLIDSARINMFRGDVWALGPVFNESYILGNRELRLRGENNQDIWGRGNFPVLNLDNSFGATVVRGGGFRIDQRLILTRGEFRNSVSNNFFVGDSVTIVRYVGASISSEPIFEKNVSVVYKGDGSLTTGPEIPSDSTKLINLENRTTQGIILSKNVTVNDSLVLESNIYTEPNDSTRFTLTLNTENNPVFENPNAEIDGNLKRTRLKSDSSKILFNNLYTYLIFPDSNTLNGVSEITFRVKPRRFPELPFGTQKVRRSISIFAYDEQGKPINKIYPIFGYGWRHSPDSSIDETNNLQVFRLKLQYWDGSTWVTVPSIDSVRIDTLNGWAYSSSANELGIESGDYAIGLSSFLPYALRGKVILEGAWRNGKMATDLLERGLLPRTPPDVFPYNRDPERANIVVETFPSSVVDWIVVEFRRSLTDPNPIVYTCFLTSDGRIVGRNGEYPLTDAQIALDSNYSKYYLAVLHRNHLAVVTQDPVDFQSSNNFALQLDFTKPELVLGRDNALRPLTITTNEFLFGMIAGDVDSNGVIDLFDQNQIWIERDFEGYYIWDTSLDGIVTTRDLNYSINNRGKRTFVP